MAYADTASHFAVIDVRGAGRTASMQLTLVREDGAEPYTKRFEAPILRAPRRRRRRRRGRRR